MKAIHLLCVGKLKDSHFEALEKDYLKRITNPPLFIHEVKASAENKLAEAEAIEKKLKELGEANTALVALTEWGKAQSSVEFSTWLEGQIQTYSKVCFIIAGAEGFDANLLARMNAKISLSPLTFPHKLARLIAVEQIYRAQTIRSGHPYHN
jgi:23S rRNA (pseudouridine1915-N3)-methyltransferase